MLRMSRAVREMLAVLSGLMALLLRLCRLLAAPRGAGWLWLWEVFISALCWPLSFWWGVSVGFLFFFFFPFFSPPVRLTSCSLETLCLTSQKYVAWCVCLSLSHTHTHTHLNNHARSIPDCVTELLRAWIKQKNNNNKVVGMWWTGRTDRDVRSWCWFKVEVSEVWIPAQDTHTWRSYQTSAWQKNQSKLHHCCVFYHMSVI